MRVLVALIAMALVLGCDRGKSVSTRGAHAVRKIAIGTTAPFAGDAQCVYYQDFDTGDFYRVSLDGTVRERVLKGGKDRGVELSVDKYAVNGSWRLVVNGIPRSKGTTVIDKMPVQTDRIPYYENTKSEPAHYANSNAQCPWTITFHPRKTEIETNHFHNVWDKVEYSKPGKRATYDFQRESPELCGVWLIDDEHAIVLDSPNILLWNFATDERTCIAHSSSAVVWPRSLHDSERIKPFASVGRKSWTAISPDDVDPWKH